MSDFWKYVIDHPRDAVIEFRGADVEAFINAMGEHQMMPDGEQLKAYLRRHKPTAIRGEPVTNQMWDETNRHYFGQVFNRDWFFEE